MLYRFLVHNLRKRKMYPILEILVKIENRTRIRISNKTIENWYNVKGKYSSLVRKEIRFNCGSRNWSEMSLSEKRSVYCFVHYYLQ